MAQMENRMNEEKEFHLYLAFPPEIQMVVIDEMRGDDRCRFTRCSKQSNKDAKSSQNFVHQLSFSFGVNNQIRIIVDFFNELNNANVRNSGYRLIFKEINGKMIKQYQSDDSRVSWEIELEGPRNIFEQTVGEFKNLLQTHQDSLRRLEVEDFSEANNNLESINFGVTSLKNLKIMYVFGNLNLRQFLSKLKRPLERLDIYRNNEELPDQISQVTDRLILENPNITNEQFRQITARSIHILIGRLSERNVLQFIRSWQDGTIGREIKICQLTMFNSTFDMRKLLRLLRLHDENQESGSVEIKHYIETGKSANFNWFPSNFYLEPINQARRQ